MNKKNKKTNSENLKKKNNRNTPISQVSQSKMGIEMIGIHVITQFKFIYMGCNLNVTEFF
jgi:hypothetical protein